MAEEQESRHITCQHPDDFKQEKKQSVNESKPVDRCPDVKHQHTDDVHSGDGDKLQNVDDKTTHQPGDASRGDYERESPKKEKTADAISEERSRLSATAGEDHTRNETEQETTTSQNPANREEKEKEEEEEEVDGPKTGINEESSTTKDTNSEAGEDVSNASASEEEMDRQADTSHIPLQQKASPVEKPDEQRRHVETIGPATTEDVSEATKVLGGGRRFMVAVVIVVLVAMLVQLLLQPESPPPKNDLRQIDIFLKKMEKVKSQYPNQRAELWKRSRIHLKRHLQTTQPTEPVSLILTSGLKAERTMHCLAQSLAHAFSSALNASVLHIDGASKASQDSDQVKLDIDSKLQGAFEGDKPVAVIHRFEELPPGSTLIFYRYCDHENAAYKKTFLIFTVLLGEEEEIPAETRLNAVEEMVDDHLQRKFLSHGRPVSFDRMDLDKYGGLWSRISHLILPVAAEERTERDGC